jgi:hypothetical protein
VFRKPSVPQNLLNPAEKAFLKGLVTCFKLHGNKQQQNNLQAPRQTFMVLKIQPSEKTIS